LQTGSDAGGICIYCLAVVCRLNWCCLPYHTTWGSENSDTENLQLLGLHPWTVPQNYRSQTLSISLQYFWIGHCMRIVTIKDSVKTYFSATLYAACRFNITSKSLCCWNECKRPGVSSECLLVFILAPMNSYVDYA